MPPPADFPSARADWLTVADAVQRILDAASPLPARSAPLADAAGRVLAEEVVARVDLPPWDNAAMDGYALRSSDLPEDLPPEGLAIPVEGEVRAGDPPRQAPAPGRTVRIMTGAPVPEGLDTVLRVEDTDGESGTRGTVVIHSSRDRGRHIRPAGQDMRRGRRLLSPGERLTPGRMGLLAAAGRDPVLVHPPPRVMILPTGDELRRPGDFADVAAGFAIPESNGPVLAAACRALGLPTTLLPPTPDDDAALDAALEQSQEADVLITLGGASMGTADRVKVVLGRRRFELDFWRVRMRPGSPFSFGHLPRSDGAPRLPVFGLPGNPASAFVTFLVLVRPFLMVLMGRRDPHLPTVVARTGAELPAHPERTQFVRVRLEDDGRGSWITRPTGPQGSGLVQSVAAAEALAVVPAGPLDLAAGAPVRILRLDEGTGQAEPGYRDRDGTTE
jgi:molybdopterin molybdotransferase